MKMALRVDAETLVIGLVVALTIVAWGYFLNASGLLLQDAALLSKLNETIGKVLSPPFYAFLLLFPLTWALLAAFTIVKEKTNLHLAAGFGLFAGGLAAVLLFKNLRAYTWPLTFYGIGLFLFIELMFWNLGKAKHRTLLRAVNASFGPVAVLVCLGVFLSIAVAVNADFPTYLSDFEGAVISNALTGAGVKSLSEHDASLIITNQRMLIDALIESNEFRYLRTSADSGTRDFIRRMEDKQQELGTKEYRSRVEARMKTGGTATAPVTSSFEVLKAQVPLFAAVEKNFWFVLAFLFTSVCYLVVKVVFKPLLLVYAILVDKLLKFVYTQFLFSGGGGDADLQQELKAFPKEDGENEGRGWF